MEDNGAVVQTGNAADRRSVAGFCSLQVKQGKLTLNIIFSSVVCLSFAANMQEHTKPHRWDVKSGRGCRGQMKTFCAIESTQNYSPGIYVYDKC